LSATIRRKCFKTRVSKPMRNKAAVFFEFGLQAKNIDIRRKGDMLS
jgi:hypothetical protein